FGVHLALPDATRDDLRVLRTEIDDGNSLWHVEKGANGRETGVNGSRKGARAEREVSMRREAAAWAARTASGCFLDRTSDKGRPALRHAPRKGGCTERSETWFADARLRTGHGRDDHNTAKGRGRSRPPRGSKRERRFAGPWS